MSPASPNVAVRAALAEEPSPKKVPRAEQLDIKLPIGTIKGKPLSETIIRERRRESRQDSFGAQRRAARKPIASEPERGR